MVCTLYLLKKHQVIKCTRFFVFFFFTYRYEMEELRKAITKEYSESLFICEVDFWNVIIK